MQSDRIPSLLFRAIERFRHFRERIAANATVIGVGVDYDPADDGWQLPLFVSGLPNIDHPYWNPDTTHPLNPPPQLLAMGLSQSSNPVFYPPGEQIRDRFGPSFPIVVPSQIPSPGSRPYYILPGDDGENIQELYWDGFHWWLKQGPQWWFFPKEPFPPESLQPEWMPYEPGWGSPRPTIPNPYPTTDPRHEVYEFAPVYNPFWSLPDFPHIVPPSGKPAKYRSPRLPRRWQRYSEDIRWPIGPPTQEIEDLWLPLYPGWVRGPAWEDNPPAPENTTEEENLLMQYLELFPEDRQSFDIA